MNLTPRNSKRGWLITPQIFSWERQFPFSRFLIRFGTNSILTESNGLAIAVESEEWE